VTDITFIAVRWLQVEFESHRLAALARRQLVPADQTLFDGRVEIRQVDWSDPETEVMMMENTVDSNKIIQVKNIPTNTSEQDIKHWFNILTEGSVDNVVFTQDSGVLVTFIDESGARKAIERGSQATVANVKLELSWWKPRSGLDNHRNRIVNASMDLMNNNQLMPLFSLPPPTFEGPLERLHHLSMLQGWGVPQYECSAYDSNGQTVYQYSVQVPNVPGSKLTGEVDPDKHQALMDCAKAALQGISKASYQRYYSSFSPQVASPSASLYYRTPAPAQAHTLLQPPHARHRRASETSSYATVVRPVKEETNLVVDDNVLSSMEKAMETMHMKPILAVPPNIKKSSANAGAAAPKLRSQSQANLFGNNDQF